MPGVPDYAECHDKVPVSRRMIEADSASVGSFYWPLEGRKESTMKSAA